MTMTNFVLGFVVGVLIYDLINDQRVIKVLIKAFRDINKGFKKVGDNVRGNDDDGRKKD